MSGFFQKKRKNDCEVIRFSTFRSQAGWFFECAVWLLLEEEKNLHVPARVDKKGWVIFWNMIRDFLMELDNLWPKFHFEVLKADFKDLKADGLNFCVEGCLR